MFVSIILTLVVRFDAGSPGHSSVSPTSPAHKEEVVVEEEEERKGQVDSKEKSNGDIAHSESKPVKLK